MDPKDKAYLEILDCLYSELDIAYETISRLRKELSVAKGGSGNVDQEVPDEDTSVNEDLGESPEDRRKRYKREWMRNNRSPNKKGKK